MNNMNKAFGIINFAGNHIKVEGLQEYRPCRSILIPRKIPYHRFPDLQHE